jgi:hypothetical protein
LSRPFWLKLPFQDFQRHQNKKKVGNFNFLIKETKLIPTFANEKL